MLEPMELVSELLIPSVRRAAMITAANLVPAFAMYGLLQTTLLGALELVLAVETALLLILGGAYGMRITGSRQTDEGQTSDVHAEKPKWKTGVVLGTGLLLLLELTALTFV